MFYTPKSTLSICLVLLLSGCTIPGSSLSLSDKNTFDESNLSDEQKQKMPVEQINVYPLTPSFVTAYAKSSDQGINVSKVNSVLDEQIADYEYTVGVGDILNITVWDHPELTIPAGSYRSAEEAGHWVHADGRIFYPYIGFIPVAGKTVVQIRWYIAKRLAKYIETPQVDVNIAAFRSQQAYVTGEITNPGKQPITNIPLTLLDAINLAGGLTTTADWRNVNLTRNGQSEVISLYKLMQKGDLTQNRLIAKGDIIHVPRNDAQKVFVLGDVKSPEMLKIDRDGMTLTEALSSVGGINELSADATGIFVVRSAERDTNNEAFLKQRRDAFNEKIEQQQVKSTNTVAETNSGQINVSQVSTNESGRPERLVANIYQLNISDAAALVIGTDFKLQPYDVVYVTAAPIERYNRVIRQLVPTISAFNELTEGMLRVRNW
ncbi:polysaccharide export protein [uncultured Psychromonas sp.]|uniref:polysaccharide export protein n=1 Tax=uncultured Psychromonas sp. TaxID=173974 RepID=UPI00260B9679|nr:polysaccharide export protein [uncultured Psychromonas sp.]